MTMLIDLTAGIPAGASKGVRVRPGGATDIATIERVRALLRVSRPSTDWWRELTARLNDLSDDLIAHRTQVEGPKGLHAQMLADQPRMRHTVDLLEQDHRTLATAIASTRARVVHLTDDPRRAPATIAEVADLLDRLERHQRRARQALQDTYLIDLGGE